MPVSTIATSASTRSSIPSIFAAFETRAPIRLIPVGLIWPSTSIRSSGTTWATAESRRSASTWAPVSRAEKPWIPWVNVRSAWKPPRAVRSRVADAASVPPL